MSSTSLRNMTSLVLFTFGQYRNSPRTTFTGCQKYFIALEFYRLLLPLKPHPFLRTAQYNTPVGDGTYLGSWPCVAESKPVLETIYAPLSEEEQIHWLWIQEFLVALRFRWTVLFRKRTGKRHCWSIALCRIVDSRTCRKFDEGWFWESPVHGDPLNQTTPGARPISDNQRWQIFYILAGRIDDQCNL